MKKLSVLPPKFARWGARFYYHNTSKAATALIGKLIVTDR